jgi:hypothetical protein
MDKVKLQEMVKEEVQSLLSEVRDDRSPAQKLQSVIRRLNAVGNAYFRHLAAELQEISDELEGR